MASAHVFVAAAAEHAEDAEGFDLVGVAEHLHRFVGHLQHLRLGDVAEGVQDGDDVVAQGTYVLLGVALHDAVEDPRRLAPEDEVALAFHGIEVLAEGAEGLSGDGGHLFEQLGVSSLGGELFVELLLHLPEVCLEPLQSGLLVGCCAHGSAPLSGHDHPVVEGQLLAAKQQVPVHPAEAELPPVVDAALGQQGEGAGGREREASRERIRLVVEVDEDGLAFAGLDEAVGVAIEVGEQLASLDVTQHVSNQHFPLNVRNRAGLADGKVGGVAGHEDVLDGLELQGVLVGGDEARGVPEPGPLAATSRSDPSVPA